jgi:2-polyprenyl-3-methyl-5-hydroxy-6-metoxy-1,4-benzoquinol methylase
VSYPSGWDYQQRFDSLAAAGQDVHGEADFVIGLEVPGLESVLDAGCGTGRVGIELARRGLSVVGVDVDPAMLGVARSLAPSEEWPSVEWVEGDLATVSLGHLFDAVVMAGNVMIFVSAPAAVVANMARHVRPGGLVVAGFTLGRVTAAGYDDMCQAAGLELVARWATWDRETYLGGGDYAVSVHRNPA